MSRQHSPQPRVESRRLPAGGLLWRRGEQPENPLFLDSGQVGLGVASGKALVHALGVVQGPFWLDATEVLLHMPYVMDAVAQTDIGVHSVPASRFLASLSGLSPTVRAVMHDIALAHRQQAELAVSRLARDAEARCAEWLLNHAESHGPGAWAVTWHEHKRLVARQLGIAPETLSRVLRHLHELKLISGTGRVLAVLDPVRLRQLADAGLAVAA